MYSISLKLFSVGVAENEAYMRTLRKYDALIYFMAAGDKLTREQVYGTNTNNIYAIWPVGRYWKAAHSDGFGWTTFESVSPYKSENEAYAAVIARLKAKEAFKNM